MLQISIQRTQTVFRTITTLEIPTNGLRKKEISQKACAERTRTQRACKVRKCKAVRLWRSSDKGRHIFAGAGGRIYRPKVQKAFDKSEKNRRKLQKAKDKMPTKRQYEMKRVFDEQTGKAKYVVVPVDVEKPFKPDGLGKTAVHKLQTENMYFVHRKIAETEKDNSAVEGAHKTEQRAEDIYHYMKYHRKSKAQRKRDRLERLHKKQVLFL